MWPRIGKFSRSLGYRKVEARKQPIFSEDSRPQTSEGTLKSEKLPSFSYVTQNLSPDMAILHVCAEGKEKYTAYGFKQGKSPIYVPPTKKPDISPGASIERGQQELTDIGITDRIKGDMADFSRNNQKIGKWLNSMYEKHRNNSQIVVADHTQYDIPWELLDMAPGSNGDRYLGSSFKTVRWNFRFEKWDDEKKERVPVPFRPEADVCQGKVVAYLEDRELKQEAIETELSTLGALEATVFKKSENGNMLDFENFLEKNEQNHGLVYIACHGGFGNNTMWIGSEKDREARLYLVKLYDKVFKLVEKSQPLVFVNACHSGQLRANESIPDSLPRGFSNIFFEKGARGFLGTLGPVGNEYASKFMYNLVQRSKEHPELSLCEVLRDLRAEEVDQYRASIDAPGENFVYSFMYVFYGNPMMKLKLNETPDISDEVKNHGR